MPRTIRRLTVKCLMAAVFLAIAPEVPAQDNVDLVKQALDNPEFEWNSIRSDEVILFYQPGTFAGRHRFALLRSAEIAIAEVLEFMDEPEYGRTLHVFYVGSRGEMEKLVGQPYTGSATWTASGIFLVCSQDWRSFDKHEITHVLTMGMWGSPDPSSRWMIEGVAIYNDGWCGEYSIDEIAAEFLSQNKLPPLETLFTDYRELGEIRAGMYSGSFIGFLREMYGAYAVRGLWKDGASEIEELLGLNIQQLEKSWKSYLLDKVGADVDVDLETINDKGCG